MPSKSGATVSLCLIVRNEEKNLRDCLTPVSSLFDEIIIVDTGSTDRTRDIAREFTGKVHEFRWADDFAAARNESLRHAQGDWIFWLDADDRLPPRDARLLQSLIEGLGKKKQAYLITTMCPPQFECEGVRHLSHFRLFRRDPAIRWKGRVHEQLRPSPQELGFEVRSHDLQILHTGYADSSQQIKKAQRDLRLLRMDFAADPDDLSTTLHLALANARVSNYSESKKYLRILEAREPSEENWRREVYKLLTEVSLKTGECREALQYADKGLATFPQDVHLLYGRAQALYEMDVYEACVETLLHLRNLPEPQNGFGISLSDVPTKWAPLLLADAWREQGKPQPAIELLESILKTFPGDIRIMHSLGLTYLRAGQRQSLLKLRQKMELLPQGEVFSLLLLISEKLIFRELANLEEPLERLISLAPQMAQPRILRVEYLCRIRSAPEALLAACRDALRLCPGHPAILARAAQIEKSLEQSAGSLVQAKR